MSAGHDLAVDRERDVAVDAFHAVVIPLWRRFHALFGGKSAIATASAVFRHHGGTVNRKEVPIRGVPIPFESIENLHLHRAHKWLAHCRYGICPDVNAGVALRLQVAPLGLEDEILIHPIGAKNPGGHAGTVDHSVGHREGVGAAVDVHPARKIAPIEERLKSRVIRHDGHRHATGKERTAHEAKKDMGHA